VCVLHSVERHCVCTAQCREAIIVSTNYTLVHLLDNKVFYLVTEFLFIRQLMH